MLHMQYPNISHHYKQYFHFNYIYSISKKKKNLYILVDMENYFATDVL